MTLRFYYIMYYTYNAFTSLPIGIDTSVTIYRWWSRWKYIVSSVDHPGLDPVGLLVVIGGCYCT